MDYTNITDHYKALNEIIDAGYPEVLREMAEAIFDVLEAYHEFEEDIQNRRRAQLAFEITEQLRQQLSGRQIYVSKGLYYEVSLRNREIYDDFTGNNLYELVRKYNLSEMQIRRILAEVKKMRLEESQGKLDL